MSNWPQPNAAQGLIDPPINSQWPSNPTPSNPWDAMSEDSLLVLWNDKKAAIEAAKNEEMELRKYIVKREFPKPNEGMNTKELGQGYQLKASVKYNYNLASNDVVEDCRYINEFVRTKQEGGLNILIGRPDSINDDPNGSEAQIKPYVEWCLKEFYVDDKFVDMAKYQLPTHTPVPPVHMEKFDVFIRNDGTIEELHKIIDEKLVSYVKEFNFGFKAT